MRPLALLLVLLLAAPAFAQVIPGANPTGGSGGGGGNVTGTFTTGVVPMGTATHTLADSLNAVMLGTNGAIGFNNTGKVEVVAETASLANAGLLAGTSSVFTIHDEVGQNDNQLTIYGDADGIANAATIYVAGASPTNFLSISFGDGAGGFALGFNNGPLSTVAFSPSVTGFASTNFQFGAPGSNMVTSPGGSFAVFDVSGIASGPSGYSNAFAVFVNATGPALLLEKGFSNVQTFNNAATVTAITKAEILNGSDALDPTGLNPVATLEITDTTADISFNLFGPNRNRNVTGVASLVISSTQTGAGTAPYLIFQAPSNHGAVGLHAPDATTGNAQVTFTLPIAYPAANGQPLVSSTAGVMSFAAGKTQAYVVCTGAACATSCTLTFTGGILTANSGTCP